ncbi:21379_t:CDS:2 [Rhizophagus irregularis]|nr:21379_t:CDS:2 [Rhizophagus irregularis]
MTTTATITQEVKSSVEEQKFLSGSENLSSFKNTCNSSLLPPLFAPLRKFSPLTDTTQQFDNNNMVWEPLGPKKSYDFNECFAFAKKLLFNEPVPVASSAKAFTNPSINSINSPYYDYLINGGGSFNNGSGTKFNGCTTDNEHNEGLGQQNPLYGMAFTKPLVLSSHSAWSSLEDLTTPTTATTNSTVTSRCSTPATSGWSFNDHTVDSLDSFVAQQQKDTSPLKSRPSLQNFHALKRNASLVDSNPSLLGSGVQVARRSSNTTVMSDTNSEQSEKSPTIEAEKEQKKATLYKTEMCRNWEERGSCRYGTKCQFAHSENELRKVQHHPKYKTEICKTFWQNGTCPYGKRCCFIHNDKERLLLCKRRNSTDNVKNSNKKDKSKGLSKFGSDPALYGSYVSDSSNSSSDTSIPSPPLVNSAATTPTSSSNSEFLAFANAYFSPNTITLSPDTVIASNASSSSSNRDDETVIGSANSSVNNTPTKKRRSTILSNGFLGELLSDAMDDSISQRFDENVRTQARRRASMTSCKLEKSLGSVIKPDTSRERSISMSVNVKQSGDRVINPSAIASQSQLQQQRSRLAIFRNLNRG